MMRELIRLAAAAAALSLPAQLPGQAPKPVPLLDNLGSHGYEITTREPLAQRYFDQGLRLYYAFNHAESVRAFREAQRLDPDCAMCAWGEALAFGPNINAAMDSASGVAAYRAVQRARAAAHHASPREKALIEALSRRYAAVPPADRAALDSAYAAALGEASRRFPDDAEIATLHAESILDLSPWTYWTPEGEPRPQTPTALAQLEKAIAANPDHPGACHFFIHAVEAVHPERAVDCAERLADLMPGAGHLVHMPGHIYIRVGRWADAIHANEHAVHADETYIRDHNPEMGIYTAGYYPHNFHFMAFAAAMAGQGELAVEAARKVSEKVPAEIAVLAPDLAPLPAYHHLALVTFGRWKEVLDAPLPPATLSVATGLATYARGVAFASLGGHAEAREALSGLRRLADAEPEGPTKPILRIAALSLAGEIASLKGRHAEAVEAFAAAAEIEDGMMYMEPPLWYYPVRHSLGKALLAAGRPAEAERAYREDLERFPENGWSLFGLARSLEAQGRKEEARQAEARFRKAWAEADVKLGASRM